LHCRISKDSVYYSGNSSSSSSRPREIDLSAVQALQIFMQSQKLGNEGIRSIPEEDACKPTS